MAATIVFSVALITEQPQWFGSSSQYLTLLTKPYFYRNVCRVDGQGFSDMGSPRLDSITG